MNATTFAPSNDSHHSEAPQSGEYQAPEPGGQVVVVDDEPSQCGLAAAWLQRAGHVVATCGSGEEALERLSHDLDVDVIVTDLQMVGLSGVELCARMAEIRPDVPVIIVTGYGSLESAVLAMRAGAFDFITKPVEPKVLAFAVQRALHQHRLREEVKRLRSEVDTAKGFDTLTGKSPAMRRVHDLIGRLSSSDASVLVTGESGTGKELVARAIHDRSERKAGPFIAINCAAMPASLLESELFGHTRGAFTDAKAQRTGLFVQATGGTLFLDEIGELPLDMQPKLLRALQERRVRPVGGNSEMPFDARVISATNRDLEAETDARRFRVDLFYRINVVHIHVPPLRERGNDVLLLAQHFLGRAAGDRPERPVGLTAQAAQKLLDYDWPGNVRELENCIERAVALSRLNQVTVDDLPERIRDFRGSRVVADVRDVSELVSMDEVERRYILRVISLVNGNKSRAAEVLGFDRRTLYRKLDRYAQAQRLAAAATNTEPAAATATPPPRA